MEYGKVSCIIASYNTPEKYLLEAVESILEQTYNNLELIVVDDGSEHPIKDTLKNVNDKRLIIMENDKNQGVTFSRNRALECASGEFMAVMDADDVSDITRFEKEINYFKEHPECDLVSSQMAFLAEDGRENPNISIPKSTDALLAKLFWDNSKPFPHGPAMIRMEFLKKNNIKYNECYKKALDYRLWVDCARFHGKFHIIDEYLYYYRVHSGQISQKSRKDQIYFADMICLDQLEYLGIVPNEEEINIHLYLRDSECWNANPEATMQWKDKLIQSNCKNHYCSELLFNREVNYRVFKMCYKEYVVRKNKKFRKYFIRSMSCYCVMRSMATAIRSKLSKQPKTLKV